MLQFANEILEERIRKHPSWVVLIELFIGLGWIRAAVEKVISGDWWSGEIIRDFVDDHADLTLPWYRPILDHVIEPMIPVVVVLIVIAQLVAGTALVTAIRLHQGIFIGMTMNINFIMIGAVDPSIFYLMLQAALALWLFENRQMTDLAHSYLVWIMRLAGLLFVVSAPFVRTLDPGAVVEDPAVILCTYGLSIGTACWIALRRIAAAEESRE